MAIFEEKKICIKFCFKLKKVLLRRMNRLKKLLAMQLYPVQELLNDFHASKKVGKRISIKDLSSETGLSVYLGIMRCLREAVRLKRPERWQNNDWILHVGNARPHTAHVVLQFLAKHSTIQIPHPPYSPDLAPNDFFLYTKLKMNLKRRKFDNVDMIQAESKATLRNLSKSDFISCFDNWKKDGTGVLRQEGHILKNIDLLIMSLRNILADDLKWRSVGRMEAGQSQVEVAKWLNVNKSVVRKIWKQFIERGTIKRKEGFGRKRKIATSEDRYLVVTAKRHREMTAIQLSNELSSATGTRISRQTVYRRLHEGALYARRPMVCIPLTSAHRRARLNWCLEHHAWTHDQWANVLFSDESRFSLNTDSRRVFIWREPGTRYHPGNIREIDSFRGGSLLVWAGISSSRRTPLHIFSGGTLTAQRYRDEILEPYLRPYRDQIGHNLIFMDDNARPHRARLVNEYLQSENIRRMDWPARSPDLNPIEHVWDTLGRRIGARHPSLRTLVELRTALLEEWGLLPLDLLQSLVNSMRARCETLIAVRGDHTPY
ncbi:hypothetical protein LAZ67_11002402 [Cordylochernes scorpioides]|uniref:Transposase n=1 Tax=Cordylochernes scorpioides TaxID=51811 RepID=A0ABY6KZR6_9ARAC|nr:hypothetical protein LAZ67_11002402 [Cordylochernes scorpioides]